MLKLLPVLLRISGTAMLAIVVVLMLTFLLHGGLRSPADPVWLYEYQSKFMTNAGGNRLIGGGYLYFPEGRDVWIRFRAAHEPNEQRLLGYGACSPQELDTIRRWFLENFAYHNRFLIWSIPIANRLADDRQSLENPHDLKCFLLGELIEVKLGDIPKTSGWWFLYNQKTRFYYLRYVNYN